MKELTDVQFDTFVKVNQINSIYQTSAYAKVMQKNGYQTLLLGLFDAHNTICGASLILIENINSFKYAYAPRGFIIDFNNTNLLKEFTLKLKKYLKDKNIVAIKINPMIIKNKYNNEQDIIYHNENFDNIMNQLKQLGYYHFGYNNYFEALKPRFEAILPLQNNFYNLFGNIKKSFRKKIRNADKYGIVIHKGTETNIENLYFHAKRKYPRDQKFLTDIYECFKEKEGADIYYAKLDTKKYLTSIQDEYEKQEIICDELDALIMSSTKQNLKTITKKISADNTLNEYKNKLQQATVLLRDYPNGMIVASALVITKDKTVTLFMDGYNKKYRALNAKHLLLWKLIEKYAKLGYESFDLGGITNILDTNDKYKGLNEFRLSFNPGVIEYIGDLELICNQPLYFMYRNSLSFKNIIKK